MLSGRRASSEVIDLTSMNGNGAAPVAPSGSREADYSFLVRLMEAATPQVAARTAAAYCAVHCRAPAVAWLRANEGRSLQVLEAYGLAATKLGELKTSLGTLPRWELLDAHEQGSIRDRFLGIVGGADSLAIDGGDCLVLVSADRADLETLGPMGPLLEAVLRHLATIALAEARNESLDLGIAVTAHEFLAPVVAMKHALELLERTEQNPELKAKLLSLSLRELKTLTELCGGLLRWSFRPEPPQLQTVELSRVVQEAAEAVEFEAEEERIRLVSGAPVEAQAEPRYLAGAVRNVLRGVLGAFPGTEPLELRVDRKGSCARIEVRLQGDRAGDPSHADVESEWLFDPFAVDHRASLGAASRRPLGLFMSRKIVEAHGGRIGVGDGNPGTTFLIELPFSERKDPCASS